MEILKKRFGLREEEVLREDPLQIGGIFLMHNVLNWEEALQLIVDLLSTKDGRIS